MHKKSIRKLHVQSNRPCKVSIKKCAVSPAHLHEPRITSHEISKLTRTEHVPFRANPRIPQLPKVRISHKRLKKNKHGGPSFSHARHLHESRTTNHEISELTQTGHVPFRADPRIPQLTQAV